MVTVTTDPATAAAGALLRHVREAATPVDGTAANRYQRNPVPAQS
jgi:hypothetical protein